MSTMPPEDNQEPLDVILQQQDLARGERLLYRLTEFGRLLWESGSTVGPHQIIELAETLNVIDITNREDFYYALKCSLVTRHEQEPIFDQLFNYFWFMRTHLEQKVKENNRGIKRNEQQMRLPPSERKRLAEHLNKND